MTGAELVLGAGTAALASAAALEAVLHRRRLERIPLRVHVNGTRGKSSVTRLIAAGLQASGRATCAKTTGTLPRMIFPDGREVPVFRPAKANVIEQTRIVATAVAHGAQAVVLECMALQPELQWLSEAKLVRATHAVITNARPDHLDVMGPGEEDVAWALAGMIPLNGILYTAEYKHLPIFEEVCRERRTRLVAVTPEDIAAITPADMAGFTYTEHPDNAALVLRLLMDLGIPRAAAIRGMWTARPDPGALTEHALHFFGRTIYFFNGFAANDPQSTEQIWRLALNRYPGVAKRIAIFNCRADRADRSIQLGAAYAQWPQADHVMLIGSGTYLFARAAVAAGVDWDRFVFAENRDTEETFEIAVSLIGPSALVMGMGNIGGPGLPLVRFFANRAPPDPV